MDSRYIFPFPIFSFHLIYPHKFYCSLLFSAPIPLFNLVCACSLFYRVDLDSNILLILENFVHMKYEVSSFNPCYFFLFSIDIICFAYITFHLYTLFSQTYSFQNIVVAFFRFSRCFSGSVLLLSQGNSSS